MTRGVKLPHKFSKCFDEAAKAIGEHQAIRIVSHYDADGITAASVMVRALTSAGKAVQTSIVKSLDKAAVERFSQEDNECVIFLDMGSGQIDGIESMKAKALILDHHKPVRESESVLQINPHFFGLDGMKDVCASGLAFLTAIRLDNANWETAPVAITGIVGDMQNIGGLTEINESILSGAIDRDLVSRDVGLKLAGPDLLTMLSESYQPFIRGISGRKEEAKAFLASSDFDPSAAYVDLDAHKKKTLKSIMALRLLSQGCGDDAIEHALGEILTVIAGPLKGMTVDMATDLVNACGRMDRPGMGIALCLGDADAIAEADGHRSEYVNSLIKELMIIEEGAVDSRRHIQIIRPVRASLAGAICGTAMQYLLDGTKPTIAITKVEGTIKVSSRGTASLVSNGLDLAESMRSAAEKLGGIGGGHKIAAGATVPLAREDEFLSSVDEITGRQMAE